MSTRPSMNAMFEKNVASLFNAIGTFALLRNRIKEDGSERSKYLELLSQQINLGYLDLRWMDSFSEKRTDEGAEISVLLKTIGKILYEQEDFLTKERKKTQE